MVYSPEAPLQSSLTYCREEFSSEVLKYLIASEDLPFNFVKNPDMQHFSGNGLFGTGLPSCRNLAGLTLISQTAPLSFNSRRPYRRSNEYHG